jgi:hypothetical protein
MRRIGGMNRITLIGILVLFSACSHYEEVARNPASFKNETCDKIIEGFLSIAIAKNDSIDSYLNKGIFNSDDLKRRKH